MAEVNSKIDRRVIKGRFVIVEASFYQGSDVTMVFNGF